MSFYTYDLRLDILKSCDLLIIGKVDIFFVFFFESLRRCEAFEEVSQGLTSNTTLTHHRPLLSYPLVHPIAKHTIPFF
jgi:hypothetical protein